MPFRSSSEYVEWVTNVPKIILFLCECVKVGNILTTPFGNTHQWNFSQGRESFEGQVDGFRLSL